MLNLFDKTYQDIVSVENLLSAWQEFIRGKRHKPDVQLFFRDLFDNIVALHNDLANRSYRHDGYYEFNISDPKPRRISKARVRDRLVHHAVYRILYPFFDKQFIFDSYSCRRNKGMHKALRRLYNMFLEVSNYNSKTCWTLKLDIRKFFASIDHRILKNILVKYIPDQNILWLLQEIISSFKSGLPLGNLTSQLLVNIYLNELDHFMKHELKIKQCIRYADDFIVLSQSKKSLTTLRYRILTFLRDQLNLSLHPDKILLKTFASGIDFLGWVNFPDYRVLRTATKRRMIKRIILYPTNEMLQSYLGLLKHGTTAQLQWELVNSYWLFTKQNRVS